MHYLVSIAFSYGDPHIKTVDGLEYTFNGLGEYWLVKADGYFHLQGRTKRAINVNTNTESNATVFSAFAAQDLGNSTGLVAPRICIMLSSDESSRLSVHRETALIHLNPRICLY